MKRIATALALVLVAAAVTAGTTAAGGNGAQKTILRHTTTYTCGGGAVPAPASDSFAVLNARNGKLMAEVVLRHAIPNATYTVWVIQTPSGADCATPNFTMKTNGQGNAARHWEEPILAGTTGAWVAAFNSFAPNGFLYGPSAVLSK
jgi:hypothetical protein